MADPNPNWSVRHAAPEHAEGLAHMQSESFKDTYLLPGDEEHNAKVIREATAFVTPERIAARVEVIEAALDNPETQFYQVAVNDEGRAIGLVYGFKEASKQELFALYVDKEFFGAGVGEALAKGLLEWADKDRPIELGVVEFNHRAQKFYSKMGFEAIGKNPDPYYPFMDEITMERPVGGNK